MPTILSFYQDTVPRGKPFAIRESWLTGVMPDILINPEASNEMFVSEIIIACSEDLVFTAGDLDFTGWDDGGASPVDVQCDTLAEILALGENYEIPGVTPKIVVTKIKLNPPLLLTDAGGETLNIQNISGTPTGTLTGTIEFLIKGWKVLEANH